MKRRGISPNQGPVEHTQRGSSASRSYFPPGSDCREMLTVAKDPDFKILLNSDDSNKMYKRKSKGGKCLYNKISGKYSRNKEHA